MKKSILGIVLILGAIFITCTNQKNTDSQVQKAVTTGTQTKEKMKNLISIVEIPTANFSRAITFYKAILGINIEEMDMGGIKMGLFPNADEGVFVQLINGDGYKTSADGIIVYLNGGDDLQKVVNKIEANGGKIVVPKTEISPDMGFFAMFIDTEGNKLGLHSFK